MVIEDSGGASPVFLRYYVHGNTYIDERAVLHDDEPDEGQDYYYLLRELYTVDGLVNGRGREVERYQYDAYGDVVIHETLSADVDYDGTVAPADAGLVMFYYGSDPCSEVEPWLYDVNFDGTIDSADKGLVKFYYGSAFKQQDYSTVWNPYFFSGRRLDIFDDGDIELSLQHNRRRTFDRTHGRWMQRDPKGYVDGGNLYEGLASNPQSGTDPMGTEVIEDIAKKSKEELKNFSMEDIVDTIVANRAAYDAIETEYREARVMGGARLKEFVRRHQGLISNQESCVLALCLREGVDYYAFGKRLYEGRLEAGGIDPQPYVEKIAPVEFFRYGGEQWHRVLDYRFQMDVKRMQRLRAEVAKLSLDLLLTLTTTPALRTLSFTQRAFAIDVGLSAWDDAARGVAAREGVSHFDDLAHFRRGLDLPAAGSADDAYTLAKLRIGGQDIYGISAHGQGTTFSRVNPITRTHAEADAVQQAINAGLGGRGGRVQLFLDRAPCRACGRNRGIGSLARELGVDEIEVLWPDGSQVFLPTPQGLEGHCDSCNQGI